MPVGSKVRKSFASHFSTDSFGVAKRSHPPSAHFWKHRDTEDTEIRLAQTLRPSVSSVSLCFKKIALLNCF